MSTENVYLKKLSLGYMRAHQPFETLPEEYFACTRHDPHHPLFLYGFAVPFDGTFTTSVELLKAMRRKIPHNNWSDPKKWKTVDAICKYVDSQIESDMEIHMHRSHVDCGADVFLCSTSALRTSPRPQHGWRRSHK
ncbi:hypothetical protein C8R45DRAFT_1106332 [Mycena sanguinolenta]|nr:hypothetical protein C8R45DRAFT_1106332 [Mycena sanguinolenta]